MNKIEIILEFRSPNPLHEQIVDRLREQLATGKLPQGTRMPTVRELAEVLQVHFNTIARAYRQLEKEGWLSTRPGRGTFVWRTENNFLNEEKENLETLTQDYVSACRERGYPEMEILRELRRQMLPGLSAPPEPGKTQPSNTI